MLATLLSCLLFLSFFVHFIPGTIGPPVLIIIFCVVDIEGTNPGRKAFPCILTPLGLLVLVNVGDVC